MDASTTYYRCVSLHSKPTTLNLYIVAYKAHCWHNLMFSAVTGTVPSTANSSSESFTKALLP